VLQFDFDQEVREHELLAGRSERLRELIDSFFRCFLGEEEGTDK
jgi:hypothetical protein